MGSTPDGGELDDGADEPRKWDATWGDKTALLTGGDPCKAMANAMDTHAQEKQGKAPHDPLLVRC